MKAKHKLKQFISLCLATIMILSSLLMALPNKAEANADYYYKVYSLTDIWNETGYGALESKVIYGSTIKTTNSSRQIRLIDYIGDWYTDTIYTYLNYSLKSENIGGYTNYFFELGTKVDTWGANSPADKAISHIMLDSGSFYPVAFDQGRLNGLTSKGIKFIRTEIDNGSKGGYNSWEFTSKERQFLDSQKGSPVVFMDEDRWNDDSFIEMRFKGIQILELSPAKTIYRHKGKGTYLREVVAKEGTYPDNGQQGSYWYVKDRAANKLPEITNITVKNKEPHYLQNTYVTISGSAKDADNDSVTIEYSYNNGAWQRLLNVGNDNPLPEITNTTSYKAFEGRIKIPTTVAGNITIKIRANDSKATSSEVNLSITVKSPATLINEAAAKLTPRTDKDTSSDSRILITNTNTTFNTGDIKAQAITDKLPKISDGLFYISNTNIPLTNIFGNENYSTNKDLTKIRDYAQGRLNQAVDFGDKYTYPNDIPNPFSMNIPQNISFGIIFRDLEKDYRDKTYEDKRTYLTTPNKEQENEPLWKEGTLEVKFVHHPTTLDNPVVKKTTTNGTHPTEQWIPITSPEEATEIFGLTSTYNETTKTWGKDKRGTWDIYFRAKDDLGREIFEKEGTGRGSFTIHNPPYALVEEIVNNSTTLTLSAKDSYDLDYQFSMPNNGIYKYQWYYQFNSSGVWEAFEDAGSTWYSYSADGTNPFFRRLNINKSHSYYQQRILSGVNTFDYGLLVTDYDGATGFISGKQLNETPPTPIINISGSPIYTGRLGSDALIVKFAGMPKTKIFNYAYSLNFSSVNNNFNTTSLTGNSATQPNDIVFNRNTLKNSGDITRLASLNLNNNATASTHDIQFKQVEIENMWLADVSLSDKIEGSFSKSEYKIDTVRENDEFLLVVETKNDIDRHAMKAWYNTTANPQPRPTDGYTHLLDRVKDGLWVVKLKAPQAKDGLLKVPIYIEIRNKDDDLITYDANDTLRNGIFKEIPVLSTPISDLGVETRYYKDGEVINDNRKDISRVISNYTYENERVFFTSYKKGTKEIITIPKNAGFYRLTNWYINNQLKGEITSNSTNPQKHETNQGFMTTSKYLLKQETIEYKTDSTEKGAISHEVADRLEVIPVTIIGKDIKATIGDTIYINAEVNGLVKPSDANVYSHIKYKDEEEITIELKQSDMIENIFVSEPFVVSNKEGIHTIDYIVESKRSGEEDETMHILATDKDKKFQIVPVILEVNDIEVYATYKEKLKVKAINLPANWFVKANLVLGEGSIIDNLVNNLYHNSYFDKLEDNQYELDMSRYAPIIKDAENIINRCSWNVEYKIITDKGEEFVPKLVDSGGNETLSSKLTIITPSIGEIGTVDEIKPHELLNLNAKTIEYSKGDDKFRLEAIVFKEADNVLYPFSDMSEGGLDDWNLMLNTTHPDGREVISNKAGDYTVVYKLLSNSPYVKGLADELIHEKEKPVKILGWLNNLEIQEVLSYGYVYIDGKMISIDGFTRALIPHKEYRYTIESSINIDEVVFKFYENAAKKDMKFIEHDEENNVYRWEATVLSPETLNISSLKGELNSTSKEVIGRAEFTGKTKDNKDISEGNDYMIETVSYANQDMRVMIDIGNVTAANNIEKTINKDTSTKYPYNHTVNAVAAGDNLYLKGLNFKTNVPLHEVVVSYSGSNITLTSEQFEVRETDMIEYGYTETYYSYKMKDEDVIELFKLSDNEPDGDKNISITVKTINGAYRTKQLPIRVYTPIWVDLQDGGVYSVRGKDEEKGNPISINDVIQAEIDPGNDNFATIITDNDNEFKARTSIYTNKLTIDIRVKMEVPYVKVDGSTGYKFESKPVRLNINRNGSHSITNDSGQNITSLFVINNVSVTATDTYIDWYANIRIAGTDFYVDETIDTIKFTGYDINGKVYNYTDNNPDGTQTTYKHKEGLVYIDENPQILTVKALGIFLDEFNMIYTADIGWKDTYYSSGNVFKSVRHGLDKMPVNNIKSGYNVYYIIRSKGLNADDNILTEIFYTTLAGKPIKGLIANLHSTRKFRPLSEAEKVKYKLTDITTGSNEILWILDYTLPIEAPTGTIVDFKIKGHKKGYSPSSGFDFNDKYKKTPLNVIRTKGNIREDIGTGNSH